MMTPESIGIGICFFFLMSALIKLNIDVQQRVPFKWIEQELKDREIVQEKEFLKVNTKLDKLHDAIMGDVDKKGIITKLHEHNDRLEALENI